MRTYIHSQNRKIVFNNLHLATKISFKNQNDTPIV